MKDRSGRLEKVITIISAVAFLGIVIAFVIRLSGNGGAKPHPQAKVNQGETSAKVATAAESKSSRTDEWTAEFLVDPFSDIPQIRKAAKAYVEVHDRGCTAKGFSSILLSGNLYFVAVDVSCRQDRRTVNLVARRFYILDQKSSYWKLDPLYRDSAGLALSESRALASQNQ